MTCAKFEPWNVSFHLIPSICHSVLLLSDPMEGRSCDLCCPPRSLFRWCQVQFYPWALPSMQSPRYYMLYLFLAWIFQRNNGPGYYNPFGWEVATSSVNFVVAQVSHELSLFRAFSIVGRCENHQWSSSFTSYPQPLLVFKLARLWTPGLHESKLHINHNFTVYSSLTNLCEGVGRTNLVLPLWWQSLSYTIYVIVFLVLFLRWPGTEDIDQKERRVRNVLPM